MKIHYVIAVMALILMSAMTVTAKEANGQPFEEIRVAIQELSDTINARIDALEQTLNDRIDAIELTPGPIGLTGPKGADGADGATGLAGADGVDGADGATGLTGATGADGAIGPKGDTGNIGATGPAGADGEQGIQGIQGPVGLKGDKGDTGNVGPAGADGTVELIPRVVTVPRNSHPPIPPGSKVTCFDGPSTFTGNTCPVVKWNGLTYWAYSYTNNANAMNIVAYHDADNSIVSQTYKNGARYVYDISINPSTRIVTFKGQSDRTVTMTYPAPLVLS